MSKPMDEVMTMKHGWQKWLGIGALGWCILASLLSVGLYNRAIKGIAAEPNAAQNESATEWDKELDRELKSRVRWELLGPYDLPGRPHITKLRIVLEKTPALPGAKWVRRDKEVVIEITDRDLVYWAERSLTMPLRYAVPDGFTVNAPGQYCIGTCEIVTTRETFFVGISTVGFSLNTRWPLTDRMFFSWKLAKLIDDQLYQEKKEHLPRRLFEGLSNEDYVESNKKWYEEYQHSRLRKEGGKTASGQ